VKEAFVEFIENVPFYGAAVLCIDHPEVQKVVARVRDRRVITYGFSAQADWRGENIRPQGAGTGGGNLFDAVHTDRDGQRRTIADIALPMPGRHNVQNALAATAVAVELGCSDETIRAGFARFGGVRRRFTRVGDVAGATVIDDYAHHPVEIRAVLAAAREAVSSGSGGRVIAVAQPHRFTRLRDLMSEFQGCFNDADVVFVAPVYPAGEPPIAGVDSAALVSGLKDRGHRAAFEIESPAELAERLSTVIEPGDMVVCLGAGDITKWAAGLASAIAGRRERAA